MANDPKWRVTRYGNDSREVVSFGGLGEDHAIDLCKLASGLPLGGWRGTLTMERKVLHVGPETIIAEGE